MQGEQKKKERKKERSIGIDWWVLKAGQPVYGYVSLLFRELRLLYIYIDTFCLVIFTRFCTELYDDKYGFKYSYLILITELYDDKYGFKYSYLILIIIWFHVIISF